MNNKIAWYAKQLLPLKYESNYNTPDGKFHTIWRMWLGKTFAIKRTMV